MEKIYSDFDFTFTNNLSTGVNKITNADSVNQSIKNILMTNKGEVPFNPLFGSRLNHLLFEPINYITTALIKDEILTALNNFEPRIKIEEIKVRELYDEKAYKILLKYILLYFNESVIIEFKLKLKGV
jgi:phage baseplate assembly protein W